MFRSFSRLKNNLFVPNFHIFQDLPNGVFLVFCSKGLFFTTLFILSAFQGSEIIRKRKILGAYLLLDEFFFF